MTPEPIDRTAEDEASDIRRRLKEFLAREDEELKKDDELIRETEQKAQAVLHPTFE